ncbi:MAG TPA: hypothetical protein PLD88_05060, partial [Candidatus Berkiella sp.]|nr:hypothetical protein [Candidatus Berkiella sp.]
NIAVNQSNIYLTDFFSQLAQRKIAYPEATTYLLKRNGVSYECHDGQRKEIYNRQKAKAKVKASRMSELQEQLSDYLSSLDLNNSDNDYSDEENHSHYLLYRTCVTSKQQSTSNEQIAYLGAKTRL